MAIVATGFFDGVHLGHRHVIEALVSTARERGEESIVITFWPHPRAVLQKGARDLRLLSSQESKIAMIKELGVDRVEVLPFNPSFAALTAEEYLKDIVLGRFGGTAMVIGYDNRIGSDDLSCNELVPLANSLGIQIIRLDAVGLVSSTQIRLSLAEGNVERANAMLGYHYFLNGVVVGGKQLGRTIGFPTANMSLYNPLKMVPMHGVYASEVVVGFRRLRGMTNIGNVIETHIFDFDADIYSLDIKVYFLRRIRDEKNFSSVEELKAQLLQDKQLIESMSFD